MWLALRNNVDYLPQAGLVKKVLLLVPCFQCGGKTGSADVSFAVPA